jgi:hypothetical protein
MRIGPQESVDPGVLLDRMTDAFLGLDGGPAHAK